MTVEKSDLIYLPHQLHNFSFGKMYFFDCMMVSEFKEGIILSQENTLEFIQKARNYYNASDKLVYISNRLHSYSVDPMQWVKLGSRYHGLLGIGVVNYSFVKKKVFHVEKVFCKKPMIGFNSLNKAVEWAYEITKDNNSKVG
ncbi:hypothetical protein [Ascidiimonas sp. W6]|uniref:hypothetical protein n=1 Tax=Ascidiimonas meishanensis TaxID=3128903 RepID=UPI0030EF588C